MENYLGSANSLALASSFAAGNLLSELFGNAALSTRASVTVIVVVTFHPTPFAGCVFWQFLAAEGRSFNVGIAVSIRFASLRSDESTFVVLVAAVQRLTLLVVAGRGVTSSLEFLEFWCILRRAEFHHAVADPVWLGRARVVSTSAVDELGGITGQDALSHHGTSLLLRVQRLLGKHGSQQDNGNDEELHSDGISGTKN